MEKKMTKREMFAQVLDCVGDNEVLVEFINHEMELLDRKKTTRKPTKAQIENESIKEIIVDALNGNTMSVGDLMSVEGLTEYTSQKISSLLTQLKKSGEIVRIEEKGKAYFTKA